MAAFFLRTREMKYCLILIFITYIILLNISFPNMGGRGLYLPFNSAVWAGFFLLSGVALWPAAKGVIAVNRAHIAAFLLLAVLGIPFLWSWGHAAHMASPRFFALLAGVVLFFALTQRYLSEMDWAKVLAVIFIGMLLQLCMGVSQILFFTESGWTSFLYDSGIPRGVFQQRNVFASFVVTGFALSGFLVCSTQKIFYRAIILIFPTLIPIVLYHNGSLTGLVSFLVVLVLVGMYLFKKNIFSLKLWLFSLVLGFSILVGDLVLSSFVAPRTVESIASNTSHRLAVYLHSFSMILEKPLTGFGYGSFQSAFIESYAGDVYSEIKEGNSGALTLNSYFTHPHNELLLWGVEGGFVPFFAIIIFIVWFFIGIVRHSKSGDSFIYIALLFPLAFHSMTELPFYHSSVHWLTFVMLLAYVSERIWGRRLLQHKYTFSVRFFSLAVVPMVVLFMFTNIYSIYFVASSIRGDDGQIDTTRVINPFGMKQKLDELNIEINLSNSLQIGDRGTAENALSELEEIAKVRPTLGNLNMLKSGYEYLGVDEKVFFYQNLINTYYPQTDAIKVSSGSG